MAKEEQTTTSDMQGQGFIHLFLDKKHLEEWRPKSPHSNMQDLSIPLKIKHGIQSVHISNMQSSSDFPDQST